MDYGFRNGQFLKNRKNGKGKGMGHGLFPESVNYYYSYYCCYFFHLVF